MQGKVNGSEMMRFGPVAEVSIQQKLHALGGREVGVEEDWHADERYGVSVQGRRFVFRDPAAFYHFEEFIQTELATGSALFSDMAATLKED